MNDPYLLGLVVADALLIALALWLWYHMSEPDDQLDDPDEYWRELVANGIEPSDPWGVYTDDGVPKEGTEP